MALDLISSQIAEIFDDYNRDMKRKVNNSVDKIGKEAVSKLKSTSPKKTGDYAKGWKLKRERGNNGINDVTIHNATDWHLTHLLENGHVIRNAKGTYGRTSGQKHIKPVEEFFNSEVVIEIPRELET